MIKLTIFGQPQSKSNFRFSRKNPKTWRDYEKWHIYEEAIGWKVKEARIRQNIKTIEEPCLVVTRFYFKDKKKRDIHNYTKSLYDALEKAGLIADDYLFQIVVLAGANIDKENPRVEVEIYKISNLEEYFLQVKEKEKEVKEIKV